MIEQMSRNVAEPKKKGANKNKEYYCHCGKKYSRYSLMTHHALITHNRKPTQMGKQNDQEEMNQFCYCHCGLKFRRYSSLLTHARQIHKIHLHRQNYIQGLTRFQSGFKRRKKYKFNKYKYYCDCGIRVRDLTSFYSHFKLEHIRMARRMAKLNAVINRQSEIYCLCGAKFRVRGVYLKHLKEVHGLVQPEPTPETQQFPFHIPQIIATQYEKEGPGRPIHHKKQLPSQKATAHNEAIQPLPHPQSRDNNRDVNFYQMNFQTQIIVNGGSKYQLKPHKPMASERSSNPDKIFCICGKFFPTLRQLKIHLLRVHRMDLENMASHRSQDRQPAGDGQRSAYKQSHLSLFVCFCGAQYRLLDTFQKHARKHHKFEYDLYRDCSLKMDLIKGQEYMIFLFDKDRIDGKRVQQDQIGLPHHPRQHPNLDEQNPNQMLKQQCQFNNISISSSSEEGQEYREIEEQILNKIEHRQKRRIKLINRLNELKRYQNHFYTTQDSILRQELSRLDTQLNHLNQISATSNPNQINQIHHPNEDYQINESSDVRSEYKRYDYDWGIYSYSIVDSDSVNNFED